MFRVEQMLERSRAYLDLVFTEMTSRGNMAA